MCLEKVGENRSGNFCGENDYMILAAKGKRYKE